MKHKLLTENPKKKVESDVSVTKSQDSKQGSDEKDFKAAKPVFIMGRKRTTRGLWVIFLSIFGTASIVFSSYLSSLINFSYSPYFFVGLGILSLIAAIVIGLSR